MDTNNYTKFLKGQDTLAVVTKAKELLKILHHASEGTPKRYQRWLCKDMHDCLMDIITLSDKCNAIPLNKEVRDITPTKELVEERLHYHIIIEGRAHDFQALLEIAEEEKNVFTPRNIKKMKDGLGSLGAAARGWEKRDRQEYTKMYSKFIPTSVL